MCIWKLGYGINSYLNKTMVGVGSIVDWLEFKLPLFQSNENGMKHSLVANAVRQSWNTLDRVEYQTTSLVLEVVVNFPVSIILIYLVRSNGPHPFKGFTEEKCVIVFFC